MGATKEKLFEAEYFLAQMEEKRADQAPFKYSLSAFLSAARSVTFYAQKQFKHAVGFEEWYANKQEEMGADPTIRFFLEARNMVLKQEHIPTHAQINVSAISTVSITSSVEAVVIRADGTREVHKSGESEPSRTPGQGESEATVEWVWYFEPHPDNVPEKDVITLCAEHVAKLRAFVEECESTFASD